MCRVCFADLHPTSQCPFTYYSSNILSVKVITASYEKAAEKGKDVVEGKQQQAQKEKLSKRAERKERPRDDQARKAKVKKREQCERGIDIVRKNRKRNVKESMKRNLTDNRKRKSIIEDIEMTMMTVEKSTEEMTDPGRGVIASAITTVGLAITPLIPTMAFFWNQAQTTMTRVGPRYHIGSPKVDLTNLI